MSSAKAPSLEASWHILIEHLSATSVASNVIVLILTQTYLILSFSYSNRVTPPNYHFDFLFPLYEQQPQNTNDLSLLLKSNQNLKVQI